MPRKRKKDKHLPQYVYLKHGAYYYVKEGKWTRLSADLDKALSLYARLLETAGNGMDKLIDKVHPDIIQGKAEATTKQYAIAAHQLKKFMREFDYDQVKPSDVAAIKRHYSDRQPMGNRILSYLNQVFSQAVESGMVQSNPCADIKPYPEKPRDRYITDSEWTAIRSAASENLRPIIDVAYLTGQRISDVLNIRIDDISEDGIYFRQQKTGARIMIKMTEDLENAVDEALELPRKQRGDTLFCTKRGARPYAYRTVRDMWSTACNRAGVKDANLHDIRAKSLTDADAQGHNATVLGGHTSPNQTKRYLRLRKTLEAMPPSMKK